MFLAELPPQDRAEYALVYEARAVHDTATLKLGEYLTPAGPSWIVATVSPGDGSGSATVPGAYIEAKTGRFVSPGGDAVVSKIGSWTAVAASDPDAPKKGRYSWTEPLAPKPRIPSPEDFYSPFAQGGTIVFRPEPAAEGPRYFGSCRLLFPEWGGPAAEPLKAAPQLAELFARASTEAEPSPEAVRAVAAENGLTAAMAFRALLRRTDALRILAGPLHSAADARRLSVFVHLVLTAPAANDRAGRDAELSRLIARTNDPKSLLAIAYAAFAASLFAPRDAATLASARRTLEGIRRRAQVLNLPLPEGSPLSMIFEKAGVT